MLHRIDKNGAGIDTNKIVFLDKQSELGIKFILDNGHSFLEVFKYYESKEQRDWWFAEISKNNCSKN